jgi:hypothetical protein
MVNCGGRDRIGAERSPCSNISGPWVEGLWSLGRSSVCRRATSAQASCLTNVRALSGTPALWRSFFGPGPPPSLGSFAVLPSRLPKFGPGARACVVGRCIRSLHCNSQMQPALLGNSTRTHNGDRAQPRRAFLSFFFAATALLVRFIPYETRAPMCASDLWRKFAVGNYEIRSITHKLLVCSMTHAHA